VADPFAVAKLTVTVWLLASERRTVTSAMRVPPFPSVIVTSSTWTDGGAALPGVRRKARFGFPP
jgi:hypothetical protein